MVPAEWMEVLAAWEAVEPRVKRDSCDTLKEWAKSNCLIMFFAGTGALSPVTPCFGVVAGVWLCLISPMCLRRPWSSAGKVVSLVPNKTVPRSEVFAGIEALRYAQHKIPLF